MGTFVLISTVKWMTRDGSKLCFQQLEFLQ